MSLHLSENRVRFNIPPHHKPVVNGIVEEIKAFFYAITFPFFEKDVIKKTAFFVFVSFVPFINLLLLRGWRMELTHRIGWGYERILPSSKFGKIIQYAKNGLKLWIATAVYLLIPGLLISKLGLKGTSVIVENFQALFTYLRDYWRGNAEQGILSFAITWLFAIIFKGFLAFLIQNIWLIIYLPMYRIAMIRTSLTGNLLASHLALGKNFTFLRRNFKSIFLLFALFFTGWIAIYLVTILFTMTVILVPLIPVFILYMGYWSSGYDYGLLAKRMVEQENLAPPVTKESEGYLV